jgi:hypothetical protein
VERSFDGLTAANIEPVVDSIETAKAFAVQALRTKYRSDVTFCAISPLLFLGQITAKKMLQFSQNVLFFAPYGYSKEKRILPSCS